MICQPGTTCVSNAIDPYRHGRAQGRQPSLLPRPGPFVKVYCSMRPASAPVVESGGGAVESGAGRDADKARVEVEQPVGSGNRCAVRIPQNPA
jgi:hypothetical protein